MGGVIKTDIPLQCELPAHPHHAFSCHTPPEYYAWETLDWDSNTYNQADVLSQPFAAATEFTIGQQ